MKLFDLHCDTLTELFVQNKSLHDNDLHISLKKAQKLKNFTEVFAIWCGDEPISGEVSKKKLRTMLEFAHEELKRHSDMICLFQDYKDEEHCKKTSKRTAFLAIEGAELIDDYEDLVYANKMGVKIITLTWNFENKYAFPSADPRGGLKEAGKKLVTDMENLGIIPDVSHLSEEGFWDVCEIASKPFIASHSCSKEVYSHHRNLSDEQFSAIMLTGGIVGLNFNPPFLTNGENASIKHLLMQVEHFLGLGGHRNLAIGSDFDGIFSLPAEISDISDIDKLYEEMIKYYDEQITEDIFFNNANEFIKNY